MRKGIFSTYTGKIILVNVVVFFLSMIFLSTYGESFLRLVALQPSTVMSGQNIWTIFTSIFMHVNIGHLLANMISLFFLGLFAEQLIGKKRYLTFYLAAGVFAGMFYVVLSFFFGITDLGARLVGSPNMLALGASGAVFGVLGLLAILTPKNRVYLIAGPLIAIIIQGLLMAILPSEAGITNALGLFVTFYFLFSIFAILSFNPNLRRWAIPLEMPFWVLPLIAIVPLVLIGLFIALPIGNTAHLGGLLVGLAYGLYLRKKYPRKTNAISRYFSK